MTARPGKQKIKQDPGDEREEEKEDEKAMNDDIEERILSGPEAERVIRPSQFNIPWVYSNNVI